MNRVVVSGYTTKDVTLNGTRKIGSTQIAVERDYPYNKDQNGKEIVDFLNLKFIGEKIVTRAAEWIVKGTPIIVEGRCQRDYTKRDDGKYEYFDYILVSKWEFQKSRKDTGEKKSDGDVKSDTENEATPASLLQAPDEYVMSISDVEEDLPFVK